MRSWPSNLSGAVSVTDAVPSTPTAAGRGTPSTVTETPSADVGLPNASCATIATRVVPRSPTISRSLLGDITSRAVAPARSGIARSARAGVALRRRRRDRQRAAAHAPRRLEQETRLARRSRRPAGAAGPPTRPSSACPAAIGAPSGSTASTTISAKLPASSAVGASTTSRGNGASCRSTSVSRAAPAWSTARAMPVRTPGGTWIGISTRPWRSATTGPNCRPATRMVTEVPALVWNGNTVEPSSAMRAAAWMRRRPLPSSTTSSATCGKRSARRQVARRVASRRAGRARHAPASRRWRTRAAA